MKKIIFTCLILISFTSEYAQVVKDNGNLGQYKRMVYDQWNYWEPDPGTNWLGLPSNFYGWFFWRILYSSYYHGEDRRPYRAGGPFLENQASLSLQKLDDIKIKDSINAINNTNLATLANMSGDALDTPYELFFKKKFQNLTTIEFTNLMLLSKQNPIAYSRLLTSKVYRDYIETLNIQSSRIETNHKAFIEKGERILTYLEIKKQLEFSNKVLEHYINTFISSAILPLPTDLPPLSESKKHFNNNDAQIVDKILKTFQY